VDILRVIREEPTTVRLPMRRAGVGGSVRRISASHLPDLVSTLLSEMHRTGEG